MLRNRSDAYDFTALHKLIIQISLDDIKTRHFMGLYEPLAEIGQLLEYKNTAMVKVKLDSYVNHIEPKLK